MLNFLIKGKQVEINKNIYTIKRLGIGYVFRLFDMLNSISGLKLDFTEDVSEILKEIGNKIDDIAKRNMIQKDLYVFLLNFIDEDDIKEKDTPELLNKVLQFNNPVSPVKNKSLSEKTDTQKEFELNDSLHNLITVLMSKLHMTADYILEELTLVQAISLVKSVNMQRIQYISDVRLAVWSDAKGLEKYIATNIKGLKWGSIDNALTDIVEGGKNGK